MPRRFSGHQPPAFAGKALDVLRRTRSFRRLPTSTKLAAMLCEATGLRWSAEDVERIIPVAERAHSLGRTFARPT